MTLKELAHLAHQRLQDQTGCSIRRSHVHELLASAFDYRSWAAFSADSLLADGGVGNLVTPQAQSKVIGRALQLEYEQSAAHVMADGILQFISEHRLSCMPWAAVRSLLLPAVVKGADEDDHSDEDDEDWTDEDDEDWGSDERASSPNVAELTKEQLLLSPLLHHGLKMLAESSNPEAHFLLAGLYRCKRPNPYLYEESLKGRVLVASEKMWVEEYLVREPRFRQYEAHLKAAALAGVRAAALEYGTVFENREFLSMAERLPGDADPHEMLRIASTPQAYLYWLRKVADLGDRRALLELAAQGDEWAQDRVYTLAEQEDKSALEHLVSVGDAWALDQVAQGGDAYWMRMAADCALDAADVLGAWTWQYLALEHGEDLTRSNMRAYHDGGSNDGQFYDSDFGGSMYVAGDEGLELPAMSDEDHRKALSKALEIYAQTEKRG